MILKRIQKRPFVHKCVCSQILEALFAILAECSQFCLRSIQYLIEIKRKSITLLVERGGVIGAKFVNTNFVNKLAFRKNGAAARVSYPEKKQGKEVRKRKEKKIRVDGSEKSASQDFPPPPARRAPGGA